MDSTQRHRHQAAGKPSLPHLQRSKSGTPAISLPEIHALTLNSDQRFVHRSKSTTKSRTTPDQDKPTIFTKKKPQNNGDGFVRFLQRSTTSTNTSAEKRTRLVPTSPSAWAMSPGRRPPSPVNKAPTSKKESAAGGGGGVNGVLKYFRQKKVSPIQEIDYHRFRLMHNRLLQWRFVNARSESIPATRKIVAENKLINAWARIFMLRNSIVEKKIQMQRLKQEIKLHHIISSQVCLLKEWARLESRNCEAVGRLLTKLSAMSIRLPLAHGAKADLVLIYDAMSAATGVVDNVEAIIMKFQSPVEKTCYLLTELKIIAKQQRECLEELEKWVEFIASLKW
ncbi:hypothetical protein RJ639_033148 [Escallonia herrerae]|uniref:QWRF motif-containing protein 7 n=1 Tax=Escallonia herrerae TaxID=1293975 RepID=A0AA89BAK8_9ASTE|nr:hypothetical protein RJ639_033148 [Escallonia herrerae]